MKIDGNLARNVELAVGPYKKTRRKTLILTLRSVEVAVSIAKSRKRIFFDVSEDVVTSFCVAGVALCDIPHVWGARPSWCWSCRAYGKRRTNVSFFWRVRSCGHGVLRGRRGTSWHSNMFHDLSKSRFCVAGAILLLHFQKGVLHFSWHTQHFGPFRCHFPWQATLWHSTCVRCTTLVRLKLPCLWEKSHKRVFFDVSEDVLMLFCVAGVALCDIPHVWGARLSRGWSCRAYGKGRTNVSF